MIALAHDAVTRALSPRQTEVADLVADGYTNPQIAKALGIDEGSVRVYVSRVGRKLGCRTGRDVRVEITRIVMRSRDRAA